MSNKSISQNTKKSKKSKKSSIDSKERRAKILIPIAIIAGIILVSFGVTFGTIKLVQYNKSKVLEVAMIQLPENVQSALKNQILGDSEAEINFSVLDSMPSDLAKFSKKYDLVFTYDGQLVSALKDFSEKIPRRCYGLQPSSYNREDADALALCVDHYEIAYNIEKINSCGVDYPATLEDLDRFLSDMSGYVFCPFIFAGRDDNVLLAFLSCLIESKAGSAGYKTFLDEALKNFDGSQQSFDELLNFPIPVKQGESFTLGSILDEIKLWPQKGYTHPKWYMASGTDIDVFMETGQVAVVFNSLTFHRSMSYENVSKYEACRFPLENSTIAHGVIAPAVVAVKLSNNADINALLVKLADVDAQQAISLKSMLGPSSSRAQPCDRQADDVRFWTAACSAGPLPDMSNAIFQLNDEKEHNFAECVRNILAGK